MPTIKYLDYDGLDHFWDKINAKKQDKLTAGSNITISGNTISATDTTYDNATTSTAGLMSAADKTKLNGIATGAEVNVQSDWSVTNTASDAFIKNKPTIPTVPTNVSAFTNDAGYLTSIPTASASTLGGIKVGSNLTISSDGTLSANASSVTVDSALSSTSTNPVQNKVINTALNGKQASLSTAQLNAANSGITAAKVATYDEYATQLAYKQDLLTAGDHIDITGDTISAVDYVHSEQPVATSAVTPVVTGSMISNGTITADKLASGATVQLTLSTSDIGEGSPLAANTLYGVYI